MWADIFTTLVTEKQVVKVALLDACYISPFHGNYFLKRINLFCFHIQWLSCLISQEYARPGIVHLFYTGPSLLSFMPQTRIDTWDELSARGLQ